MLDFELDFAAPLHNSRNITFELDQGDKDTNKEVIVQASFDGEYLHC